MISVVESAVQRHLQGRITWKQLEVIGKWAYGDSWVMIWWNTQAQFAN